MECENCGAALAAGSATCSYCRHVSLARSDELVREADVRARAERADGERKLYRSATIALVLGVIGMVVSCFPLPSVGAFVFTADAHKRSRALGVALPGRAKLGLVTAAIGGLLFVAFWAWVITDMEKDRVRTAARKAELVRLIASHDKAATLTQETSCRVAELHLLNAGFEGDTTTNAFQDFDCLGKLVVTGETAALPNFRFRTSASRPLNVVTVCFRADTRWYVSSVVRGDRCPPR